MKTADVVRARLLNQRISAASFRRPADVVAWLGAVQAQEYGPAKWALGLRMVDGVIDAEIERAIATGRILRTHVMRPTWHFVTPADIRWMLELTAPRVQQVMSSYNRKLELDPASLVRAAAVIERAVGAGSYPTRREIAEPLTRAGFSLDTTRLAHVVMYAELEGLICSGPRRGKQFTYGLVAERAPKAVRLSRDEALATLTRRFFRSHGPATVRDFVWWSGLTTPDVKRGLEMNKARSVVVDGCAYWTCATEPPRTSKAPGHRAHLLPIYDEYVVAYRDRIAVPHTTAATASNFRDAVIFQHALVLDGQIAGTWRTGASSPRRIDVIPIRKITSPERRAIVDAAARYEHFAGPVTMSIR